MVSDNFNDVSNQTPCLLCLVQPCCLKMCDDLLIYYTSVKNLIDLNLKEKGISPDTEEYSKIYEQFMSDALINIKSNHKGTLQWVDKMLSSFYDKINTNLINQTKGAFYE